MSQETKNALDVYCVADLCLDLMMKGDVTPRFHQIEQMVEDYSVELGGSAAIFAAQFAKLGGRAGLIGAIGQDAFGDILTERLTGLGVDLRRVRREPDLRTGLGLHLVKPDGDRATLTYSGTIDATPPSALTQDLLSECRHWHLASPFLLNQLRGGWLSWLERCRAAGKTTSMDTNWDPESRWEGVRELLPLLDVFLPNEAEAQAIAGVSDVDDAGDKLSNSGPLVIIKQGSEGATAYRQGQRWHIGSDPESEGEIAVVDSVGAGDNFDAGFLRAWLLGREVEACLLLATRCARASLRFGGGIEGQLRESVI